MDVLREREVKDSLERQLQDEQKVRGEYKNTKILPGRDRERRCVLLRSIESRRSAYSSLQVAPNPLRTYSFEKIDLAGKQRIDGGRDPRHTVISRACIERLERVFEAEA